MAITFRNYRPYFDFNRISNFLVRHYMPNNADGNWLEPAWEYMHSHSLLDEESLGKIGIWEETGEIIAVAHYEWYLKEMFFELYQIFDERFKNGIKRVLVLVEPLIIIVMGLIVGFIVITLILTVMSVSSIKL